MHTCEADGSLAGLGMEVPKDSGQRELPLLCPLEGLRYRSVILHRTLGVGTTRDGNLAPDLVCVYVCVDG